MDHRTPEPSGADSVDPVKNLDLGQPPEDWSGWFSYMALKFVLYVAKNPWEFLTSTMIILTPLMLICAYCSYKLAKEIKRQEVDQKLKAKRAAAINKSRKQVKTD